MTTIDIPDVNTVTLPTPIVAKIPGIGECTLPIPTTELMPSVLMRRDLVSALGSALVEWPGAMEADAWIRVTSLLLDGEYREAAEAFAAIVPSGGSHWESESVSRWRSEVFGCLTAMEAWTPERDL